MNAHALAILELPKLLDLVAERAASAPGAARVRALEPRADLDWLEAEHRRVGAVRSLLGGELAWSPEPVPELEGPINRLRVIGSVWSGPELIAGALLLRSARRTRAPGSARLPGRSPADGGGHARLSQPGTE